MVMKLWNDEDKHHVGGNKWNNKILIDKRTLWKSKSFLMLNADQKGRGWIILQI